MSNDGLAPSIDLAAGQFAARARYGASRWFGETLGHPDDARASRPRRGDSRPCHIP
jgi:hypothetical protein